MALIKCPECENSISDKSEVCIHCGYPIKAELEKKRKLDAESVKEEYDKKRIAWLNRIEQARKMPPEEGLKECIAIGDEGYALGYATAARFYLNIQKWSCAYDMCMKALELNPNEAGTLCNLGDMYRNRTSGYFDPEKAIECYKKANTFIAYNNLGTFYSPSIKLEGLEKYWDADKAINCYTKALEMGCNLSSTLWNLADLYAAFKQQYIIAAAYAYFAKKKGSPTAQKGYDIFKAKIIKEYGSIWIKNIEALPSPKSDDINSMIKRVNDEIESTKVRCPYCASTNVVKISSFKKVASFSLLGFASSKIGKEWHCNSCNSNF